MTGETKITRKSETAAQGGFAPPQSGGGRGGELSRANPPRSIAFEAFLISLSFFATTCLAFAKKLGMLELTWLQVFTPVMGYFAILAIVAAAGVAICFWIHLGPFLIPTWRLWKIQRMVKRRDRLGRKINAEVERMGRG